MKSFFILIFASYLIMPTANAIEDKTLILPGPPGKSAPAKVEKLEVSAVFHFYKPHEDSNVPNGSYSMSGGYDPVTRLIEFKALSWIERPEGYEMVPLKGKISADGSEFTGKVEFEGCKEFTLVRTSRNGSAPLSGKWQGSYTCLQGETGLTLTVK
jgi:hypothetical protein